MWLFLREGGMRRMETVLVLIIVFTILAIVDKVAAIVLIRMSQKNSRPSGKR